MELPNARNKFPEVQQRGPDWCIPAGCEVLLHYFDIPAPTQEDMVMEYHRRYGDKGYVISGRGLFICENTPTIDDLRPCGFPCGNFDTFTAIANSLMLPASPRVFWHPTDCDINFEKHLSDAMAQSNGVLGVIRHPNGNCHVLPIIGYNNQTITIYDPGKKLIETKPITEYAFNRDCVILRPK